MDPEDNHIHGELELTTEHDQLPNVEEYKASIGYTSSSNKFGGLLQRGRDPAEQRGMEPPDSTQQSLVTSHDYHNTDTTQDRYEETRLFDIEVDDTDPQVYGKSPSSGSIFWKYCAIFSFLVLVSVVTALLVAAKKDEMDFFHWVHGDTDSYFAVRDYITDVAALSGIGYFDDEKGPQYLAGEIERLRNPIFVLFSLF